MGLASPDEPPFTHMGVDYFGLVEVKRGPVTGKMLRSDLHWPSECCCLEVASYLDTDSCINGLHRFICQRGPVSSIRSDHGTNFIFYYKDTECTAEGWCKMDIQSFHWSPSWWSWVKFIHSRKSFLQSSKNNSWMTRFCRLPSVRLRPSWMTRLPWWQVTPTTWSLLRQTICSSWKHNQSCHLPERIPVLLLMLETGTIYYRPFLEEKDNLWKKGKWTNPKRNFTKGDLLATWAGCQNHGWLKWFLNGED